MMDGAQDFDVGGSVDGAMNYSTDVLEALRNQTGKIIDAVVGIEEKTSALEVGFDAKLRAVTQEKLSVKFSGMNIFSERALLPLESDQTLVYRVNGNDESLIAGFRLDQEAGRLLLGLTLVGSKFLEMPRTAEILKASESRLLGVIIDELVEGFLDCVDVSTDWGTPRQPVLAVKEEFLELAKQKELVSFNFNILIGQEVQSMELIVPLEVFENESLEAEPDEHGDDEGVEEQVWSEQLYQRVEDVLLPHAVEVCNLDMPLETLISLSVGDSLDIEVVTKNLRVLDGNGSASFHGDLLIGSETMQLRVADSEICERG